MITPTNEKFTLDKFKKAIDEETKKYAVKNTDSKPFIETKFIEYPISLQSRSTAEVIDEIKKTVEFISDPNIPLEIREKAKQHWKLDLEEKKIKNELLKTKNKKDHRKNPRNTDHQYKKEDIQDKLYKKGSKYLFKGKNGNIAAKKCSDCDKYVLYTSTRCDECNKKFRFFNNKDNSKRPPIKQLIEDMKNYSSYIQISKKYNVSDNAVRKWLRTYRKYYPDMDIPKKPCGNKN